MMAKLNEGITKNAPPVMERPITQDKCTSKSEQSESIFSKTAYKKEKDVPRYSKE